MKKNTEGFFLTVFISVIIDIICLAIIWHLIFNFSSGWWRIVLIAFIGTVAMSVTALNVYLIIHRHKRKETNTRQV